MKTRKSDPHQRANHQQPRQEQSASSHAQHENADSVGNVPGFKDLEEAVKRVKKPARSPVDRTAELLLEEAAMTEVAIPTPAETKRSAR